jgi:predicted nucleic acid-binding protein
MLMIVDASVLLSAYFPDEDTHRPAQALLTDYAADSVDLISPSFARYEIINACHVAFRRGRLSLSRASEIAEEISDVVPVADDEPSSKELMSLSQDYGISIYDALYLAMAIKRGVALVTADRKLAEKIALKQGYVLWIGNY